MVKVLTAGRKLLVAYLLRQFDRNSIRRRLRDALALRSRDRNMSEVELGRMHALVEAEAL
jgi:hypothetical protein